MRAFIPLYLASVLVLSVQSNLRADAKLPGFFSDNMVLQQGVDVPVWGWAKPGEKVTVTLGQQKLPATADANGKWLVRFAPLSGPGPIEMTAAGEANSISVSNILIGEVWLGSGQSNMEMPLDKVQDARREIAEANWPEIRMYDARHGGKWSICNPRDANGYSAMCYFFAREIHRSQHVPVGMINCSVGATTAEFWMPEESLVSDPELKSHVEPWLAARAAREADEPRYQQEAQKWNKERLKALAASQPVPKLPQKLPVANYCDGYNKMIAQFVGLAIRGVIWYQGESNCEKPWRDFDAKGADPVLYRRLFADLIAGWRKAWGCELPFLYVQIASFSAYRPQPSDSEWVRLQEAQSQCLSIPKTAMAVTVDIGDIDTLYTMGKPKPDYDTIHPRNKQEAARRLALCALATVYGKDVAYQGPAYESCKIEGGKIRLHFAHTAGGLEAGQIPARSESQPAPAPGEVVGFEIAGADRQFQWARAQVQGDDIVVWSEAVGAPVAVRYAWAPNPVCNLYNKAHLPAGPFRTDDWAFVAPAEVK